MRVLVCRVRTTPGMPIPSQAGQIVNPVGPATYGQPDTTPSSSPSSQEQNDPDLALVIDAWPNLPEPIKAGILAMVKAQPS